VRDLLPTALRPGAALAVTPALLAALAWWWSRRHRAGSAAVLVGALAVLVVSAGVRREARVHVEDPQVAHHGGVAEPPSGTMNRAAHGISWRLPPGGSVEVPWRPPFRRALRARVRLADPNGAGRLLAGWDGGPARSRRVTGGRWQLVPLPRPSTLGRGTLRLEWQATRGSTDLLVDLVEAVP
jgi:hypothetical protein